MGLGRGPIKIPEVHLVDDTYVPTERHYGTIESICLFCKVSDSCTKGTCKHFFEEKKKILERNKLNKDDKSGKSKGSN